MGRRSKSQNLIAEESKAPAVTEKQPIVSQPVEQVELSAAVWEFTRNSPEKRAQMLKYMEAIKLFAKKHLGSLKASQEEWNKVLRKF